MNNADAVEEARLQPEAPPHELNSAAVKPLAIISDYDSCTARCAIAASSSTFPATQSIERLV
jgi:hypothetical protein